MKMKGMLTETQVRKIVREEIEAAAGGPLTAHVYLGSALGRDGGVRMGLGPPAFGRVRADLMPPGVTVRRHTTSEIHEQVRIDAPDPGSLRDAILALVRAGRITGASEGDVEAIAEQGVKRAGELGWRTRRTPS